MTNRFNFSLRIILLLAGVVLLAEAQAATDYDIIKRYQILEDKFRTQEILRPYDNDDFILDISALLNKDAPDFISTAKDIADFNGTIDQKLQKAQDFLKQYDKTEQNLRVNAGVNIPFFDFSVYGVRFKPSVRAQGNLGFLMGIQTSNLSVADAVKYLGSDVPQELKDALLSCSSSLSGGDNIITYLINTPACGLTPQQKAIAKQYESSNYIFPQDLTVPDVYNYIKAEARAGIYTDYIYDEHFFGKFNVYGLGRADFKKRITAESLIKGGDLIKLPDEKNTTMNLALDYSLGYKNGNLSSFVGVEDLKLTNVSNNDSKGGALLYGSSALFRAHAEYLYKFLMFSVKPFVGIHKRASYGLSEGYYLGADVGAHVWHERIGLRMRGMVDNEHLTISPMANLWLMHIEYMLKTPLKSSVNGLKPATIHSVNLRFSI